MTYTEWRTISSKLNSSSPEELCEELLRWHSAAKRGLNFETDYTTKNYEEGFKSTFIYYLNHIRNPFIYNKMYNRFIEIHKENIMITILVLYYLNTNKNFVKEEYILIINKGLQYLESKGIKEILYNNIEPYLNQ